MTENLSPSDAYRNQFNENYVTQRIADILRSLMRATASEDPSNSCYRAVQLTKFLFQDMERYSIPINIDMAFYNAIDQIRNKIAEEKRHHPETAELAIKGMMYLVEASCADPAAHGRTSQRRDKFEQSNKSATQKP